MQVRDSILEVKDNLPQTDMNRQFFNHNLEGKIEPGHSLIDYSKRNSAGHEILKRIARTEPVYDRNRPHICSFYVKGQCKRGDLCPYRHEMPKEFEYHGIKRFRDRFYGVDDSVADKILSNAPKLPKEAIPDDPSIVSLYLTPVTEEIEEKDLKDYFYAFGEVQSIVIIRDKNCAFINYLTRDAAEEAAEKAFSGVDINGTHISVQWAKPKLAGPTEASDFRIEGYSSSEEEAEAEVPLPPGKEEAKYPSQDPRRIGSIVRKAVK